MEYGTQEFQDKTSLQTVKTRSSEKHSNHVSSENYESSNEKSFNEVDSSNLDAENIKHAERHYQPQKTFNDNADDLVEEVDLDDGSLHVKTNCFDASFANPDRNMWSYLENLDEIPDLIDGSD